jgi:HEAT repeats
MTEEQWHDLVQALRDTGSGERAINAASTLKSAASAEDIPRLKALLDDESFFVREAAAWPLSDLGCVDALPLLIRAQRCGYAEGYDNDGLNAALADLVCAYPAASRTILEEIATDSDEGTCETAIWLLEFCGS